MTRLEKFKPKNDLVFKKIFQIPDRLKFLIAYSLKINPSSISEINIINPEILPDEFTTKFCRLDVNAKIDGKNIDIEIQRNDRGDFRERALYYWARLYSSSLKSSEKYIELPQTIVISIIDFNLFPVSDFHSEFVISEKTRDELLTDKFDMHFFELKKIPENPKSEIELWLKFINAETEEDLQKLLSVGDTDLNSAIQDFQKLSEDNDFRELVIKREETLIEEQSALYAERKAGKEAGKEEGKKEKAIETAKNFLKMGLSVEQVAQGTGLSLEEVSKLSLA
jgi:predicted transposase/invertase (TIGR01784 family)